MRMHKCSLQRTENIPQPALTGNQIIHTTGYDYEAVRLEASW